MSDNTPYRSWFCVLNSPENLFGEIPPEEMVQKVIELWCSEGYPDRSCGVNYEVGDSGNKHMHMVLEDPAKVRFTAIQKLFPGIHIERTRGSKEEAEAYIKKTGKFEEKEHTIIVPAVIKGQIKANQGSRRDLEIIQDYIDSGLTPNEIFDKDIRFRKDERLVKSQYFRKRFKETPIHREVKVYWHVGESGCGKSYSYVDLCSSVGRDNIYFLNDYESGGFDGYNGEPYLFMDEFKGNIPFTTFLNLIDHYPVQLHCRYTNSYALWKEVHITSIFYPDEIYEKMVERDKRGQDKISQLLRRITSVIIHKNIDNNFTSETIPIDKYQNARFYRYNESPLVGFVPVQEQLELPWLQS